VNTVVYCFPAGWIWSENGFLRSLGAVDIAGSGAVHLVGGASGKSRTSLEIEGTLNGGEGED
jgi:Amt family ammonium transporter